LQRPSYEVVTRQWNGIKSGRETTEILAALYRGDPVPLLREAVCLIVDDLEATTIEADLAGPTERLGPTSLSARLDRPIHNRK
jgi:hypothetical protein